MIRQSVLPFKLEMTHDTLTPHAGLALLGEFAVGTGFLANIDKHLPGPGSAMGYQPSEFIFPLTLMLNAGGRTLEDIREIREDAGLREILPLERIPSTDATGDWLRKMGSEGGLQGSEQVNRRILKRWTKRDGLKGYTLDIDATQIVAEKQLARITYKGERGYMPIVGHLAENGLVVGDEFRDGNVAPATRNLEFIKHCVRQMPKGKKVAALRADSATYQAKVFNYCERKGIQFAIGAPIDQSVMKAIQGIPKEGWKPYGDSWIAETVHSMEETKEAFRLVVIRRPTQRPLFGEEPESERYTAIGTNRDESPEELVQWYNQRGECSENRIKELKIGFGMERMPCGQLEANALFFRIGVLAYNVCRAFMLSSLEESWHRHQVQTLRWKLYQSAGKVVSHSGQVFLKVRRRLHQLFSEIRIRIWEFSTT